MNSSTAALTIEDDIESSQSFADLNAPAVRRELINRMVDRSSESVLSIQPLQLSEKSVSTAYRTEAPEVMSIPVVPGSWEQLGDRTAIAHKWECVVQTSPDENGRFTATMHELGTQEPEEVADFNIEDVSESDRELIEPGSIFYVFAGTQTSRYGRITRFAHLRFRRLPVWTESKLKKINDRAAQLAREMGIAE